METQILSDLNSETFLLAAERIRAGEVVAFPTETVYGLGADAQNEKAVEKIFAAKGRPSDNPLILHVAEKEDILPLVKNLGKIASFLIDDFMPGPITLVLEKADRIPKIVTGGLSTVGVRVPSNQSAHAFLSACKIPVAAPSANLSGKPSSTQAGHVYEDFKGKISLIIEGNPSEIGLESTVVDATGDFPVILRPGVVTEKMILECLALRGIYPDRPENEIDLLSEEAAPRAPGMKYRHYAPDVPVRIILPENGDRIVPFLREVESCKGRIGIFCSDAEKEKILAGTESSDSRELFFYTSGDAVRERMSELFSALRYLDAQTIDVLLASGYVPEEKSWEAAYMNRLEKASN